MRSIIVASTVILALSELRQGMRRRPEGVKAGWVDEVRLRLIVAVGALAAGFFASAVRSAAIRPVVVAQCVGLVLFWGGLLLRWWSFHALGRYFTLTVETSRDQPVISEGPYRVIRHPGYAGLIVVSVGVGLFLGNWLALACVTTAVTGALVLRIHTEEAVLMHDVVGYRDYAAERKRLVPFLW